MESLKDEHESIKKSQQENKKRSRGLKPKSDYDNFCNYIKDEQLI